MEINKPIVLTSKQTIKINNINIQRVTAPPMVGQSGLMATVKFDVIGDNGKVVQTKTLTYKPSEFNAFWTDFNSGKFLYEELVEKQNLDVVVPNSVEQDFVNA